MEIVPHSTRTAVLPSRHLRDPNPSSPSSESQVPLNNTYVRRKRWSIITIFLMVAYVAIFNILGPVSTAMRTLRFREGVAGIAMLAVEANASHHVVSRGSSKDEAEENSLNILEGESPSLTEEPTMQGNSTVVELAVQRKPMVMVVACTKSTEEWMQQLELPIAIEQFLTTMVQTITRQEHQDYDVQVLLAFDDGDAFWEQKKMRELAQRKFPSIPVNFMSIKKGVHRISRIPFNEACQAAYEYGADYIVRVNDDTEFNSSGWVGKGIKALLDYPVPNLGVVGPTDLNNRRILTHDMTHRTHLDIFDSYYPVEFDNWWVDDWISTVYGRSRTRQLTDWIVTNMNTRHTTGTRYDVNQTLGEQLIPSVTRGRQRIQQFLKHVSNSSSGSPHLHFHTHNFCVLGTNRTSIVEGPMEKFVNMHQGESTSSPCLSAKRHRR